MAFISSNGLPPACNTGICIDFSFFFFFFFSFPIPFVYLFLQVVHSFYSTYTTTTTTTGDYCKMTYLSNVKGFSGVDDTTKNLNLKVR